MKIVTLTMNPSIDINFDVDQVIAEKKLRAKKAYYEAGGGGINVSRAIKRLGSNSEAIFTSGGSTGELLKKLLSEEEINFKTVEIKELTRENINTIETSTNKQYRFILPGPKLSNEEVQKALETLFSFKEKPDFLIASGSLPENVSTDFYSEVAKLGKQKGIKVIIDSTKEALCKAAAEGVYLIKPNLSEMEDLTNQKIENENQLIELSKKLINKNDIKILVVSLGAGGAILITENIVKRIPNPYVPIKSRVGAGDSMVAGIIVALEKGLTVLEAAQYGVAAGASAVMTPGTELCTKEDTDKLFEQIKENKFL